MGKSERSAANARESWWPPRLASPLWWDDRIAGWHEFQAFAARPRRRSQPLDVEPAASAHRAPLRPPGPLGAIAAPFVPPVRATGVEIAETSVPNRAQGLVEPDSGTDMPPVGVDQSPRALADAEVDTVARDAISLRNRVADQDHEIAQLRDQVATLTGAVANAESCRQSAEQRAYASAQAERANLARQLAERDRQVVELRGEWSALEEHCAQLQRAVERVQQERDDLVQQLSALSQADAALQSLRENLATGDARKVELEARTADLARQLVEQDRHIVDLQDKRGALEGVVAELRGALDAARVEQASLTRQAVERERATADLTTLAAALRDQLATKDRRITDLELRAGDLLRERDLLQCRIAEYKRSGVSQLGELVRLCDELARRASAPGSALPAFGEETALPSVAEEVQA